MKSSTKINNIICIGLDGTTWDVILPWIKDGKLSVFKRLMENGTYSVMQSTIPSLTCPALPSLYTGKNPGNTGVFEFKKPDRSLVSINDIDSETLWNILDRHGRSSCVVNLPITYPPSKLNGVMISGGLSCPSKDCDYTYPPEIKKEIGEFHSDEIAKRTKTLILDLDTNKEQIYKDRLIQHKKRYDVFKKLIAKTNYDFAIYWEGTTDSIQHYCWNHKDLILRFYQEIEQMLDDILRTFPDTNILVLSDHGFERAYSHNFNVNTWLKKEGYLKQKGLGIKVYLTNLATDIIKRYLPYGFFLKMWFSYRKKKTHNNSSKDEDTIKLLNYKRFLPGVDWHNTRAYLSQPWGISLNIENHDDEYESLREEIISKLNHLTDDSGEKVVKHAYKKEEVFKGRYMDQIPDIVFQTTEKYKTNMILLPRTYTINKDKKTVAGTHDNARRGIFIASGPDIKKGHTIKQVDITDITPTILHLLNCAIPEDLDGKVLKEIFRDDSEPAKRDIKYSKPIRKKEIRKDGYSKKEEEKVKERLAGLGYM